MSELGRLLEFMDRGSERTVEQRLPSRYGPVFADTRMPLVHDLNFLRADRADGATAEELAEEAERVQSAVAGVRHRRVDVRSEDELARLEVGFVRLGWEPQRFVLMVHRRAPDRPGGSEVLEVDEPTVRPLWAEAIRGEPHGKDETLVQQILEHRRLALDAVPTRLFAAAVDGKLVAHAELYSEDGVGQVEDVITLLDYRGRGLARAIVLHAVEASRSAGNKLTFLVAGADDWPQRLYERLGFETIGRYGRFLKLPSTA
jgi:ribosomal protein S18 acetylase RimI-like enzyme